MDYEFSEHDIHQYLTDVKSRLHNMNDDPEQI